MQENNKQLIKDLILDVLLKKVISKIVTLFPFFGLPIIGPIFVFIMTKLAKILYEEISLIYSLLEIESKVNAQVVAFAESRDKLEQDIDNEELKEDFKSKFRDLINLNAA